MGDRLEPDRMERVTVRVRLQDDFEVLVGDRGETDFHAVQDAHRALTDSIDRMLLLHDPGTRICVHEETTTLDVPDWTSYTRTVTLARKVHLVDRNPARSEAIFHRDVPRGTSLDVRTSPYICHGCRQRTAVKPDEDCGPCLARYEIKAIMEQMRAGGAFYASTTPDNGWTFLGRVAPGSFTYAPAELELQQARHMIMQQYRYSPVIVSPDAAAILRTISTA